MIGIEKITVSLSLEGQDFDVGELVLSNRKTFFLPELANVVSIKITCDPNQNHM
jgi:hypothetical protein